MYTKLKKKQAKNIPEIKYIFQNQHREQKQNKFISNKLKLSEHFPLAAYFLGFYFINIF